LTLMQSWHKSTNSCNDKGWCRTETYEHDVVIRLSDKVIKRKKELSKRLYGTSHTVSKDGGPVHARERLRGTGLRNRPVR
jgi:hypothetical protein